MHELCNQIFNKVPCISFMLSYTIIVWETMWLRGTRNRDNYIFQPLCYSYIQFCLIKTTDL